MSSSRIDKSTATSSDSNEPSGPEPTHGSQRTDTPRSAPLLDCLPRRTRHDTASSSSSATQYPDAERHRRASRLPRAAISTAKPADDLTYLCVRLETTLQLAPHYSDDPEKKCRFLGRGFGDVKNAMSIAHGSSINVEERSRSIIDGIKVASDLLDAVWQTFFKLRGDVDCLRPTLKDFPEDMDELIKVRGALDKFMTTLDEMNSHREALELFANSLIDEKLLKSGITAHATDKIETVQPRLRSGASQLLAPVGRAVASLNNYYLRTFAWPVDVRRSLGTIASRAAPVFNLLDQYGEADTIDNVEEQAKKKSQILFELLSALKLLELTANHFAETIAENWSSEDAEKWNAALRFAERLGDFVSPVQAIVLPMLKRSQNDRGEPSHRAGLHGASDAQEASGVETIPRRRRSRRRTRIQLHDVERGRAADTAGHSEILKQATALLDKSQRLPPDAMRYPAKDLLALARRVGFDTSTIDTIRRNENDPLDVAGIIRDSVASWFGRVTDLERANRMLAALPESPQVAECASKVVQRESLLAHIEACVDQQEADLIKQHRYPKARHLNRLFDLDGIALVGVPKRLPSNSDRGNQGTVFELCVQPHPVSDGDNAAPLFVHVHTRQPVTAEGCLALDIKDFNAIHVKSESQKNLGKRWERFQRSLGRMEPTVHRGPVDEKLWRRLKEKAMSS
ncbi:hypothetical protein GCT19_40950 [Paraburkholderia sp. CNPSo 3155]|uniref:hypothetical protein n=1 Tax=Paraburkholderia atlantica TaxID=2654982 RepID=UPI00128E8D1D|nr:hypothetical protein [Paraburkholderia atlantica]MPW11680.1 hypothetical protein [Paraburkholderia atlantica]